MKKQNNPAFYIALLALGAFLGWEGHIYSGEAASLVVLDGSGSQSSTEESLNLDEFWTVWENIQSSYVNIDTVDNQAQSYGAIKGLVNALGDPYSVFMNPTETEEFNSSLNGELEGIGAELTLESGRLIVVAPLKDSPAEQAGLKSQDFIYMVDDVATTEMTLFEAIMAIRGPADTEVTLTIIREGVDEPIEMTITRKEIQVPSVELTEINRDGKNYAHLSIYQFGGETYQEFEASVHQIILDNPDGLILDLRQNGGGYLESSVEVLSEFFSDKRTGVIVKKLNDQNEVTKTTGTGQLAEIPMVVLIDEGSASAAEILAGALQDYERAILIGVQSFGKGSVQELKDLPDGSTLRLTIAKWYTPNDHSIDHTGITPDIEVVEDDTAKFGTDSDNQLNAALDYLSSH
jgi:carboxyl-terminal processing protease